MNWEALLSRTNRYKLLKIVKNSVKYIGFIIFARKLSTKWVKSFLIKF